MSGYPVILNGDHAEFEAEWASKDPKTRPDWPLPSFDARDWAEAFDRFNPGHNIPEGLMLTWFANSLMRGFDEHVSRVSKPAPDSTRTGDEGTEGVKPDPIRLMKEALFACLSEGTHDRDYGGVLVAGGKKAWLRFSVVDAETSAALAARPAAPEAQGAERVRHVKLGTEYEVLHRGVELQVSVARGEPREMLEGTLEPDPVCWEGDRLVIYQGSDGKLWAREESEFDDGRFVPAPPSSSGQGGR